MTLLSVPSKEHHPRFGLDPGSGNAAVGRTLFQVEDELHSNPAEANRSGLAPLDPAGKIGAENVAGLFRRDLHGQGEGEFVE